MSRLRVSQLVLQPVLLDEHDAPHQPEQLIFTGNAEGSAVDKLRAWCDELPAKLREAEKQLP